MHDPSTHVCLNPDCQLYHQTGQHNIVIRTIFGKHDDIFLLFCKACGQCFSENRDTLFAGLKTPRKKVAQALIHMSQGDGIRATSRITGLHRDTVTRIFRLAQSVGAQNVPISYQDALER